MEHKLTKEELEQIEELRPYQNKWVALVNNKVVASGDSPRELKAKAEERGYTKFAYHLVPRQHMLLCVIN